MKMKLKLIIAFIGIALGAVLFSGCKKDEVKEQEKASVFYPRIFNDTFLFPVPAVTSVITVGGTKVFSGITYSPAKDVKISWKVDDAVVATTPDYTFTATKTGLFTVKLEVDYNGMVTTRTAKIQVN
jgi:ABC-type oligopeptide transport system substrate-binding subunit